MAKIPNKKPIKIIVMAVVVIAIIVMSILLYRSSGTYTCTEPLLLAPTVNISEISNIINKILQGSTCAFLNANMSEKQFILGYRNGTLIRVGYIVTKPGTIYVPEFNYTYSLNSTQISQLEEDANNGDCGLQSALEFFDINYSKSFIEYLKC
ncbi:MAG: hypothetical protein M1504_02830 [Candidatus Marsarchaeota archaeon]|nr:hypothetical protein [Candidatus Marsarchaeota archaeon]